MSKKTPPSIPILTMEISIDIDGIVDFNNNLGENGRWGFYDNPFSAYQFTDLKFNLKKTKIPVIGPSSQVNLEVKPLVKDNKGWDLSIDYIRLDLVCPGDFNFDTPRNKWKKVLDLERTDGAIGMYGDFFLGEDKNRVFKLFTSPDMQDNSLNILYIIQFSIAVNNIRRYCLIDPLIKTSSEDDPNPSEIV